MNTFIIETWGCQMNEYDSQKMTGLLKKSGLVEADCEADADIFILNTCSVREKAAHKIYSRLGALNKRYGQDKIVGVCGCVASQEGNTLFQKVPNLNFIIGTRSIHLITEAVEESLKGTRYFDVDDHSEESRAAAIDHIDRQRQTKAYVSIIEGCDNFCTYCVVPHTRGREQSRPLADILSEVEKAVNQHGIHEIELLGQNVNSYRHQGATFADLLQAVSSLPGVERLRFMTSHPKDFSEEILSVIANNKNICRSIHLPIQSGSDIILRKMGRKYTREQYLSKIAMTRNMLEKCWLSTDIIVGFPGETETDFLKTMDIIHRVGFDNVFSFKYSPRPNTAALELKDDMVNAEIAAARLSILQKAQENIQLLKHQGMVGKNFTVLVESLSKRDANRLTARTEGNHVVHFKAGRGNELIGKMVTVCITGASMASLTAELV